MKLYIDMDGVLCDFDKQLSRVIPDYENDPDKSIPPRIWKKIEESGERFWSEMPWMSDGHQLWETIKRYDPAILSSPTKDPSSIEGKKKWLREHLPGTPFIIESDKSKYADPGSILIDDREKNIIGWEKAKGIGILHHNAVETIHKLARIMSEGLSKESSMRELSNPETGEKRSLPVVRGGRQTRRIEPKKKYRRHEKHRNKEYYSALIRSLESMDRIADELERQGSIKEAYDIDVLSNTLQKIWFSDQN